MKEGETSGMTGAVSSSDLAVKYDEENGGGRRSDDGELECLKRPALEKERDPLHATASHVPLLILKVLSSTIST